MTKKTPEYLLKLISISLGFIFSFSLFEIIVRFLPGSKHFVVESPLLCEWNDISSKLRESCISSFIPNQKGRYTKGKFPPFPVNALKSTNDIGQFSSINFSDFLKSKSNAFFPIVSIGDSFVQALQVNNENSFHGILNSFSTEDGKKVISTAIGKGGDALSHYLLNLQYVSQQVDLTTIPVIIPVIANDFDQSIFGYKEKPGGFFKIDSKGGYEFKFVEYKRTKLSKILNFILAKSRLSNYVFYNLEAMRFFKENIPCVFLRTYCKKNNKYTANIYDSSFRESPDRYRIGFRATEIFLENLGKLRISPETRKLTLIIVDADRYPIYKYTNKSSEFFSAQRDYFIKQARKDGYTVIDMEPIFREHYRKNQQRFEFSNDGHWNSLGHFIVSEQIVEELNFISSK